MAIFQSYVAGIRSLASIPRGGIAVLLLIMTVRAVVAQVSPSQLPAAAQPLGDLPDAVMLSQGIGCPTHTEPCTSVQSPSLRFGQPVQGTTSPASPLLYQQWIDTSTNLPTLREHLGKEWSALGALDTTNGIWTPPIGGGAAATLPASRTTDVGSVPQSIVTISGNATVSSLGSSAVTGTLHELIFAGNSVLTQDATSLILPTGSNISTGPGDVITAFALGNGKWQVASYMPALNYGISALRGDPTGAQDNAELFSAQNVAAADAGGRALVLAAGNYKLDSPAASSDPNAYLLMPGSYLSGPGNLQADTVPAITAAAGQTKFGMLGMMTAAGGVNSSSGNQDILFVSGAILQTGSSAPYLKEGIYSHVSTADFSTYNFSGGAYSPVIERAAAGIVASCQAMATNGECFGLHASVTAWMPSAVQAGQFQVINNSGVVQPYPFQPDSSYGITVASGGTQNATAAIFVGGGTSGFQDGIVLDPDKVKGNLIAAYSNFGQDQTPTFRLSSTLNDGNLDLATTGKVSIGTTTGSLVDCCNMLLRYATNINLMFGVPNGAPGNYTIAAANDDNSAPVPIEFKSPLLADQGMVIGSSGLSWLQGTAALLVSQAPNVNLGIGAYNPAVTGAFALTTANDANDARTPFEIDANGTYLPASFLVIGATTNHASEVLQVIGASYLNGAVDAMGPLTAWGGLYVMGTFSITQATPAANSACTPGQIATDAHYLYTCAASGHWKRASFSDY
jgi:hypothetical protein